MTATTGYQIRPLILIKVSPTKIILPEIGEFHTSFTSIESLTPIIISFTIVEAYELEQLKDSQICFKLIIPFLKNILRVLPINGIKFLKKALLCA
ncbi:MAG: hypothetical protein ACTSRP_15910 [Candidatus Helarchaeota archaeon]